MSVFEKIFDKDLLVKYKVFNKKHQGGVADFIINDDDHIKIYRDEFIKHLECANELNGLSKQQISRLKSLKWTDFWQAKAEIEVAYFVTKYLGHSISFEPKGKDNRFGDIEINLCKGKNVFIEVKAPYRETPKQIVLGDDSKIIRKTLNRSYAQIPDNKPAIVILDANLKSGSPDENVMIKALYGVETIKSVLYDNGEKAKLVYGFNPNGFFKYSSNRNISAVGTLCFSVINPVVHYLMMKMQPNYRRPKSKYIFRVYHNPYCRLKIKTEVFKNYPQYCVEKGKTRMVWLNNDR